MAPRRARIAPPPLPTREEFLATGLKPLFEVNDPADPADFDGFIDPSEDSEDSDVDPEVARRLRRSHIGDAFRANGFAEVAWNRGYVPPADLFTSFHNDIQWSQPSLQSSANTARDWLDYDCGLLEDGGQTINANVLGASLTITGNLLMTLNTLERREWSDADQDNWGEIVVDIWRFMSQYKGTRMYLSSLYLSLMASLLDKHYFGAAHPSPFFREGPQLDDLKVLANFVVFKSGTLAKWTSPLRRPPGSGKRHMKVPRECPCTASQPVVVHATAWMETHFE
jgi:hypothetical protein